MRLWRGSCRQMVMLNKRENVPTDVSTKVATQWVTCISRFCSIKRKLRNARIDANYAVAVTTANTMWPPSVRGLQNLELRTLEKENERTKARWGSSQQLQRRLTSLGLGILVDFCRGCLLLVQRLRRWEGNLSIGKDCQFRTVKTDRVARMYLRAAS